MPRSIPADATPQRVTRSQSRLSATTDAALDQVASPPCDTELLRDLNSGTASPSHDSDNGDERSTSPNPSSDELLASLEEDDVSCSSDETWTPSVYGEDSDDEQLDDDGTSWQETSLQYNDFTISFNKVDTDLERGYFEEVKELRMRVLREFNTLSSENTKRKVHSIQMKSSMQSTTLTYFSVCLPSKTKLSLQKRSCQWTSRNLKYSSGAFSDYVSTDAACLTFQSIQTHILSSPHHFTG